MTPPFPRALVFDWDNTLVDSWDAIGEAMNYTRAAFGLSAWTLDEVRTNCTRAARDSFPEWFGSRWKEAYDIYYAGFDEVRKKRSIKVRPGAHELLLWLRERNIPSYIVSNKRGDYLRNEVERLNWQELFKAVVGAQDAPRDKPAREHVDFALQGSGLVSDASIWFVGDSETDISCARNAACTPVLIGDALLAERLAVSMAFADCHELRRALEKSGQAN